MARRTSPMPLPSLLETGIASTDWIFFSFGAVFLVVPALTTPASAAAAPKVPSVEKVAAIYPYLAGGSASETTATSGAGNSASFGPRRSPMCMYICRIRSDVVTDAWRGTTSMRPGLVLRREAR